MNLRESHLVEASTENAEQLKRKRSYVQSISSCDESWRIDWIKCIDCFASDVSFEKEVSAQSPRNQKIKRKREEKKERSEEIIKKSKTITEPSEEKSPAETDLISWMKAIEKCTLEQLKSLCKANNLAVSGTKIEVVERLVRCKRHGSSGVCPECNCARLKFEYPSDGIMALPNKV